MRTSEYYGVQVPELGDRADITVVSQAIIDSEDNQSGKVENMKASLSGSTISLVSECRTDKLVKYYNGLAVQFISPVNAQAGTAYKIKVDNLAEQPYNNKVDIKVGDIVQAIYGSTGFVSANTPIPRSSAVNSDSEVTVATSKAVKKLQDEKMPYTGGTFTGDVKMSGGKAITGAYNFGFKLLKQDGGSVYSLLTTSDGKLHVGYSNSIPIMLDAQNITVNGGFATTSQDLRGAIKELNDGKISGAGLVNDLTSGGTNKALTGEMGKKLNDEKLSKSGGQMTGQLEMTGQNYIVGSLALRNRRGKISPFAQVITDGADYGIVKLCDWSSYDRVDIDSFAVMKHSALVKGYSYIQDYYDYNDTSKRCRMWYYHTGDKSFQEYTLYIDNGVKNIRVGGKKVLTEANSGFVKEKLFDGILTRTSATLPKALTEFDIIIIEGGDGNLNTSIASGSARGDSKPNWYLPSMMIGNRIQYMYGDTNGTNSRSSDIDFEYLDIVDSKNIKFAYAYTADSDYFADKTEAHIRVWGLKYVFGGK